MTYFHMTTIASAVLGSEAGWPNIASLILSLATFGPDGCFDGQRPPKMGALFDVSVIAVLSMQLQPRSSRTDFFLHN
ncbi:hypothetical protein D1Z90_04965 [Motilimonas pumila]|uniref:Uncharacterized protein n=1 Tax=Motilimonas pumila TaxID=2303987 RepID=A0A418YHY5_9GAMM|nr:hypothetical protein D1Z90_04965 [Motilimonas pumila]